MRPSTGCDPASHRPKGNIMGGIGKKGEPPKPEDKKPIKPLPPAPVEDDDFEDGDMATPKRDRYGDDDQPI
jgi:hypothetical protein